MNNRLYASESCNCNSTNRVEVFERNGKNHGEIFERNNENCGASLEGINQNCGEGLEGANQNCAYNSPSDMSKRKEAFVTQEKQGEALHVLEARNLSFSYGTEVLFADFSLRVANNERVALSAHSGVGKTTLCRLLAGYLEPKSGGVYLDGALLPETGVCPVQMIFQHPEQVMNPYVRIRKSLEEAGPINEVHLSALGVRPDWLTRFPHELSGGELQRCCIARTLAAKPKFLIADEISTMLDALTQAQIWAFLLEYCQAEEVGLVVVTHSQALQQRLATKVINL